MCNETVSMLEGLIKSHKTQIKELEEELVAFKRARMRIAGIAESTKRTTGTLFPDSPSRLDGATMSAGDLAVQILKEAGKPMHGSREIFPAIEGQKGKGFIKLASLTPALKRKAARGEIKKTGRNVWAYVGITEDPDA